MGGQLQGDPLKVLLYPVQEPTSDLKLAVKGYRVDMHRQLHHVLFIYFLFLFYFLLFIFLTKTKLKPQQWIVQEKVPTTARCWCARSMIVVM